MKKRVKKDKKIESCEIVHKWHRNPVNILLHLIAFALLIYGVWERSWEIVLGAALIAVIGHIIQKISGGKK